MKKILVTGASGLLGSKIMALARDDFEVVGLYHKYKFTIKGCRAVQLDLCDRERIFHMIEQLEPDFVIHSAALRDLDYCETHKAEADAVNIEGTRNIRDICLELGIKALYVSTDMVFDGSKIGYNEPDEPHPINHYGVTKTEGERLMLECSENIIARISTTFGWNVIDRRLNFVTWVLNNLKLGNEIDLYTDQYRNGTYLDDAARVFLMMYLRGLKGIYHVAGKTCLNRYEMAMQICDVFGYDNELLRPNSSETASWSAKRPNHCCLEVTKIEDALEVNLLSFREGLMEMKLQQEKDIRF